MTHTTSLKVAVVIPALNEERFIGRCLESLRALALPETSVRTCVVDNGSTDRTETLARQNGANWLVVPKHTIAHSRNRGAAAAGEVDILAFLDADCLADRQWIARALDRFRESADVVAVGSYPDVLESESNIFQRTWAELCRQEWRGKCEVDWLPSANLIVRRSAFWRIGGFNDSLLTCEDVDLGYRLRALGTIVFDPEVKVYHLREPRTISEFFKKEVWHSANNWRGAFSHGLKWSELPSLVAPALFVVGAVSLVVGLLGSKVLTAAGGLSVVVVPLAYTLRGCLPAPKLWGRALLVFGIYSLYFTARSYSLCREMNSLCWTRLQSATKAIRAR